MRVSIRDREFHLSEETKQAPGAPPPDDIDPAETAGEAQAVAEQLARETNMPVEVVSAVYSAEAAELNRTAKIKTYVRVLATRKTRIRLNQRHGDAAGAAPPLSPTNVPQH
jgi:hypothetical protein